MGVIVMDTATDTLAVGASGVDGKLASAVVQRVLRGHSRLLQPSLQFVMESAGMRPSEVTEIGIGTGPGSYTGVRMAVATGKAMAHALQVPLVTIPTLDAIAQAAVNLRGQRIVGDEGNSVLVLLFARRRRAFGAWFRFAAGRMIRRDAASVREIDTWLGEVRGIEDAGSLSASSSAVPLIVHDFPPALEDELAQLVGAVDVARLQDVSHGMPAALLQLTLSQVYPRAAGEAIHAVAPDYALPVEAEAKLKEQREGDERP